MVHDAGSAVVNLLEDHEAERNVDAGAVVQGDDLGSKVGVTESIYSSAGMGDIGEVDIQPLLMVGLAEVAVVERVSFWIGQDEKVDTHRKLRPWVISAINEVCCSLVFAARNCATNVKAPVLLTCASRRSITVE